MNRRNNVRPIFIAIDATRIRVPMERGEMQRRQQLAFLGSNVADVGLRRIVREGEEQKLRARACDT